MNKYFIWIGLILLLLGLSGCVENNSGFMPPTENIIMALAPDINVTMFRAGDYNNLCLQADDNHLAFGSCADSNVILDWNNLFNFPTGCEAGQAVQVINSTLTCVVLPTDTNAQTACSDLEYLAGNGTCQTISVDGTDTNIWTGGIMDNNSFAIDLNMNGNNIVEAGDINGTYLHLTENAYMNWLCSKFGVGCLLLDGDPWFLNGVGLEVGDNIIADENIYPDITLENDLGSVTKRWLNLFVGNISADEIIVSGDVNASNINADNNINANCFSMVDGNTFCGFTDFPSGDGGGSPGGADTQIQFNDGGVFAGDSELVWDKTNDMLSVSGIDIHATSTDGRTIFIGDGAGNTSFSGGRTIAIGYRSGYNLGASPYDNVFLGYQAGQGVVKGQQNVIIGSRAGEGLSSDSAIGNTFVGTYSGQSSNGASNTGVGRNTLKVATGGQNVAVGDGAGDVISSGTGNVVIGYNTGGQLTTGITNVLLGNGAGSGVTTASSAIAIGASTFTKTLTGTRDITIGSSSSANLTSGNDNTCIGTQAGLALTTTSGNTVYGSLAGTALTSSNNTVVGFESGRYQTGGNNTFLGSGSGRIASAGTGNVFLGYQSGYSETGSNMLYISNSNTSSPLIYGEFDNGFVKINGDLRVGDNSKYYFGDAQDWSEYTDGTDFYINREVGSGSVKIEADLNIAQNLTVDGNVYYKMPHLFGIADTTQALTTINVWQGIDFNFELGDAYLFDAQDSNCVIPQISGEYFMSFEVQLEDASPAPAANMAVRITKNGTELSGSYSEVDSTKQNASEEITTFAYAQAMAGDVICMEFVSDDIDVSVTSDNTFATQDIVAKGFIEWIGPIHD